MEQIDEVYLTKAFARFGGLEDCVVKSHMLSKRHHKQGGYAFLYFKDLTSAENVLQIIKKSGGILEGVMYDAKFSCTSIGQEQTEEPVRQLIDASTDSESCSETFNPGSRMQNSYFKLNPPLTLNIGNAPSMSSNSSLSNNSNPGSSLPSPMAVNCNTAPQGIIPLPSVHANMQPMPLQPAMPMPQFSMVPMTAPNGMVYQVMIPNANYSHAPPPPPAVAPMMMLPVRTMSPQPMHSHCSQVPMYVQSYAPQTVPQPVVMMPGVYRSMPSHTQPQFA